MSLLTKWWWKLDSEEGLWQDIIKFKYLKKHNICSVKHRQNDSPIWIDLLKIRHIYLKGRKIDVKNGSNTLFWKDTWLFDKPIQLLFPELFEICLQPDISVGHMKQNLVRFKRWLVDDLQTRWCEIKKKADELVLTNDKDVVMWHLDKSGKFSMKYVYKAL